MKIPPNDIRIDPILTNFFDSASDQPNNIDTNSLFNESQSRGAEIDPKTPLNLVKSTTSPIYGQNESSCESLLQSFSELCLKYESQNEKLTDKLNEELNDLFLNDSDWGSEDDFGFKINYKSFIPQEFSEEQRRVLDLIFKEKKNVFFTGPAGTGKSRIIREVIDIANMIQYTGRANKPEYDIKAKYVAVTASTGLAAFQLRGSTLHSFAGIGLGTNTAEKLADNISKSRFKSKKWDEVELLIIDEVSMLDGELFDKLEFIARKVRKNAEPFGGIQLVISGDFFQLPPVKHDGDVKFAFEASTWDKCIQETVVLQKIYRQKDPELSRVLNEARIGRVTQSSINLFQSLSRPLNMEDGLAPTQLFSTRAEVNKFNSSKLNQLPGETFTYFTSDIGEDHFKKQLNSVCMIPEVLHLKLGAQVMLLKNLPSSRFLVNGLMGKVVGFDFHDTYTDEEIRNKAYLNDGPIYPIVRFINGYEYVCRPEEIKWEINGEVKASRTQVPLTLAWALSIHKAQGQTLEKVRIDLAKVFEKGQAYVALSRCTTIDGLQVLNFNHLKVQAHPRVIEYYAKHQT